MSFLKNVNNVLKMLAKESFTFLKKNKNNFVYPSHIEVIKTNEVIKKTSDVELHIKKLSNKISILVEKVSDLDLQISYLTANQEELLYTIDQQAYDFEQQEDKMVNVKLNSKEKKYGTN